jgi:SAM-dependent methyltransferase
MSSCLTGCDRVVALELVPEYVEMLRGRLAGRPGFEVLEGDATDDTLMMPLRGAFDAAFSFNVLEHIKDDQAAFRNIRESLVPGGRFVCFVPAFPVLYGPMDTSLGHHRRYRRRELRDKAEAAGFNVLHLYYMNSLGFFAWFLNGRVARSNTPAGGQTTVLAYDRFVIPSLRWLEGIKHPPFGQSLMLVAQR